MGIKSVPVPEADAPIALPVANPGVDAPTHEGSTVTLWPVLSRVVWPGLLALGLAGCNWSTQVDTAQVRAYEPVEALVVARDQGRVRALRQLDIQPAEAGRLQWRLPVGARVAPGDVLVRLRPDEVEAARVHAEAALEAAREQAQRTRNALVEARESLALAQNPEQIRQARAQIEQAQMAERAQLAALARAEGALGEAGQALVRTLLLAPFAGVVSAVHGEIGDKLSPALPVITLADADSLRVGADFTTSTGLSLHQPCLLTRMSPSTERLMGELLILTPSGNSSRVTADVRVPKHAAWPLGTPVQIACLSRRPTLDEWRPRLTVPRHALRGEGSRRKVWKVAANHRVQQLTVTVGIQHGEWVEVQGPLRAGDRVVLMPAETLTEGSEVRLRQHD